MGSLPHSNRIKVLAVFELVCSNGARQRLGLNLCLWQDFHRLTNSEKLNQTNDTNPLTADANSSGLCMYRIGHQAYWLGLPDSSRHPRTTPLNISKRGRKASGERWATQATQYFNLPVCSREGLDGQGVRNSQTVLVQTVRQETTCEMNDELMGESLRNRAWNVKGILMFQN